MQETKEMQLQPLGWEDTLEEGMTTHFSILAWRIPWTEEPGGLQTAKKSQTRLNQLRTAEHIYISTLCDMLYATFRNLCP